jgi:hypothetical protein
VELYGITYIFSEVKRGRQDGISAHEARKWITISRRLEDTQGIRSGRVDRKTMNALAMFDAMCAYLCNSHTYSYMSLL